MHKLMCTFATPMKKKIPDRNLDTSCPAGIPCKKKTRPPHDQKRNKYSEESMLHQFSDLDLG